MVSFMDLSIDDIQLNVRYDLEIITIVMFVYILFYYL